MSKDVDPTNGKPLPTKAEVTHALDTLVAASHKLKNHVSRNTTTIDERLSEVLAKNKAYYFSARKVGAGSEKTTIGVDISKSYFDDYMDDDAAKAAIKSLFLDLIAEAKPEKKPVRPYSNTIQAQINGEPYPVDQYNAGFNEGLERYENNLKQTINGGKK